jgi:hypothetical protein
MLGSKSKLSPAPKQSPPTVVQGPPTAVRGDFTQVTPPSKNSRKKASEPALPLYSSPTEPPPPLIRTYPKPVTTKPQKTLPLPRSALVILVSLLLLGVGYQLWQNYLINTNDLSKVVLQETFHRPRGWSLTRGASFKDGGLFQWQPQKNHYGASIWLGKNFNAVDFTSVVDKVGGPNNTPFGVVAQANGKNYENFYYLFIDGQGRFSLGKRQKNKWVNKIGWKRSSAIEEGNAKNNLRIVFRDGLILGFINDKLVGSFGDKDYKSGKVGVFSMRGSGESTSVYFDNIVVKERPSDAPKQTPEEFIESYYSSPEQQDQSDPFWSLVETVKVYKINVLKISGERSQVKTWLEYQMKNGLVVCESRVFNLKLDNQENQWRVESFDQVTTQKVCKK